MAQGTEPGVDQGKARSWVVTFVASIGLFLALYLLTLYVGHTLAG